MDEDKREDVEQEETETENETENETESEDVREEETKDEIRDEVYVNDDEVEMLRNIESRFTSLESKLDNVLSMMVDSGAIIQDSVETISEEEKEDYNDDFINIDEMDLSL